MMKGIQFVTGEKGKKTAVLIDLKKHGKLWEDFYDNLIADQRENEPRETLESVERKFRQEGKVNG